MDIEKLKNISVSTVTSHLRDHVPLEEAIANTAKRENLNDHEVKRLVEASNTLTYLKLHSLKKDKTFEFPVASFEGVAHHLKSAPQVEKRASAKTTSLWSEVLAEPMVKQAQEDVFVPTPLEESERLYLSAMVKEASARMDEELMVKAAGLQLSLERNRAADKEFLEKLAFLGFFGEGKKASLHSEQYQDRDLEKARSFAKEVAAHQAELEKRNGLMGGVSSAVGLLETIGKKSVALGSELSPALMVKPGAKPANRVGSIIGAPN